MADEKPEIEIRIESAKFKTKASVDPSSIEIPGQSAENLDAIDAGIVLRLDVQRFPTSELKIVHQLVLLVAAISPEVKRAGLPVNHLCDIGILRLTRRPPEDPRRFILREESSGQLWTESDNLKRIWAALVGEISRYEHYWLEPPAVPKKQRLSIAVVGMDYFNRFVSQSIHTLPPTYHSQGPQILRATPQTERTSDAPLPPILFR